LAGKNVSEVAYFVSSGTQSIGYATFTGCPARPSAYQANVGDDRAQVLERVGASIPGRRLRSDFVRDRQTTLGITGPVLTAMRSSTNLLDVQRG